MLVILLPTNFRKNFTATYNKNQAPTTILYMRIIHLLTNLTEKCVYKDFSEVYFK